MSVIEQIQEKYPLLTRKQREVANYMLEDYERMSYITLKEMSQDTGITEMTILQACSALGFDSFSSIKYAFRKYAAKQLELFRHSVTEYNNAPSPTESELSDSDRLLRDICAEESRLNQYFFSQLDMKRLFAAADMILEADQIFLCGRSVSTYICQYFSTMLAVLGRGSVLINSELDDSIYAALPLMTEKSLLIAACYPDYFRMSVKVAAYAHNHGVKVLSLTDSEKSPVYEYSDLALFAPTQTRMFLNTIGAPAILVNLIASAINIRINERAPVYGEQQREIDSLL